MGWLRIVWLKMESVSFKANYSMDYALPHRRRADSGAERPIMIRQCGLKEGLSLTTRFRNLLARDLGAGKVRFLPH